MQQSVNVEKLSALHFLPQPACTLICGVAVGTFLGTYRIWGGWNLQELGVHGYFLGGVLSQYEHPGEKLLNLQIP